MAGLLAEAQRPSKTLDYWIFEGKIAFNWIQLDFIGFLKENCNFGSKTLDFLRESNHFDRNQWFSLENPMFLK